MFVPKLPLSLRDLRERFPHEFCASAVWDTDASWLDEKGNPEYRAIQFRLKELSNANAFQPLESKSTFARAHLSTIAQFLLLMRLRSNRRLLRNKFHCGYPTVPSDLDQSDFPLIGGYDELGILVTSVPSMPAADFGLPHVGVQVCLAPDKK
jgi:hypothetical protein